MELGCHISVSKGFYNACENAYDLGAGVFQIFTKNPRSLRSKTMNLEDAAKGKDFCQQHNLSVVCHTPYITNLSTPKDDLQKAYVDSLIEDLNIAGAYGSTLRKACGRRYKIWC